MNYCLEFKEHVAEVWALWYSLGLTTLQRSKLAHILAKLISAASSDASWRSSEYSRHVQFRDDKTRDSVVYVSKHATREGEII